ncbi:hypothetical protein CERZMDRAFT_95359 [Cercospora zeae-maydis SCOH1-5]|uniref:Uncharacterized protein n=1 Tax=Cercospora zeae-maydis SCOH1-5 TaxID=717836 RepID=A0A6A6FNE1_9PEZI|nr:hypothetical protein CERZMDRAFT_95359 [Cercospora zeae-maydis SCOH1-5]
MLLEEISASFLGIGMQHHGALISEFLSELGVAGTDEDVGVASGPGVLEFSELDPDTAVEEAARILAANWLQTATKEDSNLVERLVATRLTAAWHEAKLLGQKESRNIGFDCVAVTIPICKMHRRCPGGR